MVSREDANIVYRGYMGECHRGVVWECIIYIGVVYVFHHLLDYW